MRPVFVRCCNLSRRGSVGDVRPMLLVLFGAVGLLLLIACANVANLLIARSSGRRRELAVREALGAGRFRIVRQLLIESTIASLVGGAGGVVLGAWLLRALVTVAPAGTPRLDKKVSPDTTTVLFAFGVISLFGGVFGIVPAIHASTMTDRSSVMRAPRAGGTSGSRRVRQALIVAEIALALVLLTGAGLMARTISSFAAGPVRVSFGSCVDAAALASGRSMVGRTQGGVCRRPPRGERGQ